MSHHWLSKDEQERRNRRILELASRGVEYNDIGKMYGLATGSVNKIVSRGHNENKENRKMGTNHTRGLDLPCAVDGTM